MAAQVPRRPTLKTAAERGSFYAQFVVTACFIACLVQNAYRDKLLPVPIAPAGFSAWPPFLLGFFLSAGLMQACSKLLGGFVRRNLIAARFKAESEDKRVLRLCNDINGIIFYTCSLALGSWALHGTEFLPRSLGGSLDLHLFPRAFPFPPPGRAALWYFLFGMGHHFERLVEFVVGKRGEGQFWSFYLHHVVTATLMLISFRSGHLRYGLPVLYLHDWAEPLVHFSKVARELRPLRPLCVPVFALCIACWGYTRVWAMCWEVCAQMHHSLLGANAALASVRWTSAYQALALYVLQLLNVHWFALMLRLLRQRLTTGAEHYASDA